MGVTRSCASCPTILSKFNSGTRCHACTRRDNEKLFQPPKPRPVAKRIRRFREVFDSVWAEQEKAWDRNLSRIFAELVSEEVGIRPALGEVRRPHLASSGNREAA